MKQRLIQFFLLMITACIVSLQSFTQAPGDAFKKLAAAPLQTPQAASFSKYVEYPVSYYNGLAQISIPIYEIISGDISVPITLSYHGGGIRVQEEASWVGLGWTLNAGGVITHDIKGGNDEVGTNHPFNQVYPNNQLNNYMESSLPIGRTGCPATGGIYTNTGATWNCSSLNTLLNGGNPTTDGEPDMYAYNFGNYSGKFFSGNGQFIDLSHNNIQFTQLGGSGFTAVTPDGFKYEFLAVEKAWSYPTPNSTNTAYYLTKITSPKGKIVTFQYKSFKQLIDLNGLSWSNQYPNISLAWGPEETVMQFPSLTENFATYEIIGGTPGQVTVPSSTYGLHQAYSSTTSTSLYLDKIVFDLGWVDFIKSPRTDLYGVKLDAINIARGPLVKSIPLTYDYFVSSLYSDDMYDPAKVGLFLDQPVDAHVINYPQSYRNRRLKLLTVTTEGNSAHNFEYYEGDYYNLPCKTAFSQDYWGYYNGKFGNPSLIPDYDIYSQQRTLPTVLSSWQGANRNPDTASVKAGSLKKIIYPTGGFSQFYYEMNEWSNLSAPQYYVYQWAKYGGVDAGVGIQKFYFSITANTYADITGGLYCNGMLDMNSPSYNCGCGYLCSGASPNSLFAVIEKVDPNTHAVTQVYPQWQFDIGNDAIRNAGGYIGMSNQLFSPGTYCITVNYPDNHNPAGDIPNNRRAELYVTYYEQVPSQTNTTAKGAGLRIASIKTFDPVNMQLLTRQFTYSGGKIMRYPVYNADARQQYNYLYVPPDGANINYILYLRYYYLYSNPPFPLSASANGSNVGYDMVSETLIGPSSIGKTQYEYKNRPDIEATMPDVYMPGIPTTGFLDNGFLKKIAVYDKDNTLLKETINEQLTILSATYWPFKCRIFTTDLGQSYTFSNYLEMSFYPVQVGKILNFTTTDNDYANGTSLSVTKQFTYNSNGLLSQESTTTSDGATLTSNYSYASDYTEVNSGWINDMKNRNMVGIPLEVYNKRNGFVTGGTFTTYLTHDNIINPYKVYQIETASPKTIASTVPNGTIPTDLKLFGTVTYDANGNLVQSRAENNIYTSYLWGYNKGYPVAKVVGKDYNAVIQIVNQEQIDGAVSDDATLRNALNILRTDNRMVNALVTTYTYKPLVGITSETDPNGRTTFYEYDSFNRLKLLRDQDGNIIKTFEYHYKQQ